MKNTDSSQNERLSQSEASEANIKCPARKRLKTNINQKDEPAIPPQITRQYAHLYAELNIVSMDDLGTSSQEQQNLKAYVSTSS